MLIRAGSRVLSHLYTTPVPVTSQYGEDLTPPHHTFTTLPASRGIPPPVTINTDPISHEDVLYRDVRLPDERSRLRESSRQPALSRLLTRRPVGDGRPHPVQHLQHSRQGGAKGLPSSGSIQAKRPRQSLRRAGLRGATRGRQDLRAGAACQLGRGIGQLRQ